MSIRDDNPASNRITAGRRILLLASGVLLLLSVSCAWQDQSSLSPPDLIPNEVDSIRVASSVELTDPAITTQFCKILNELEHRWKPLRITPADGTPIRGYVDQVEIFTLWLTATGLQMERAPGGSTAYSHVRLTEKELQQIRELLLVSRNSN